MMDRSWQACQTHTSRTFDLGDYIKIDTGTLETGDTIRLVTPRNVIFSGTADPA
ncbi:MAG: hypothetical protein WC342_00405 [Methanoregula sp.]|jgi:hypothetical protein